MNSQIFIIAILGLIVMSSMAIEVVPDYNIEAYLGDWYEVASSPWVHSTFEKNGFCSRARYEALTTGDLSVLNVQRDGAKDGPVKSIDGYATIPDKNEKAKLKVHLGGGKVPAGDYWIIRLGPIVNGQYDWAIVSEPRMLFMWVLARDPLKYRQEYEESVRDTVHELGFNGILNKYVARYFDGCVPYDD